MKEIRLFSDKKEPLTAEQLKKKKKAQLGIRAFSCAVFLLAMAGITYLLYPIFKGVGTDGWLESLSERLSGYSGIHGLAVFLLIQAMQVLIAIIPAIQVVGGVLYGWFWGAVASFAGIVLGSLAVWGIVKKLGTPLVEAVISEKHIKKFGFLEDEHKLLLILVILYIIPGIPKDVVTYIVPLTKVKMRDFFLCVMPWRIPSILLSTAFGSNVTKGNYTAAIVFISIIVLIAVIGLSLKDKILERLNKRRKRHDTNSTKE